MRREGWLGALLVGAALFGAAGHVMRRRYRRAGWIALAIVLAGIGGLVWFLW